MDAGVWDPRGGAAREVFHNSVDGDVMDVGMEGVAADGWWAGLESLGYYLHSGMERIMWMGWVIVVERQDLFWKSDMCGLGNRVSRNEPGSMVMYCCP